MSYKWIQTKINEAAYFSPPAVLSENDCYICKYNDIQNTFWFGNTGRSFTLLFSKQETYNVVCNQPIVWNNNKWWGLGYYLGFNKERYSFKNTNFKHIHKADLNDCSNSIPGVLNENYLLQQKQTF